MVRYARLRSPCVVSVTEREYWNQGEVVAISEWSPALETCSTEALVAMIADGNRAAEGILYVRERDQLLKMCRRILGSAHQDEAEDIVQDAVTKTFAQIRAQGTKIKFVPYARIVARNHCYQFVGRKNREQPLSDLAHEIDVQAEGRLLRLVEYTETKRDIVKALDTLNEKQRNAVLTPTAMFTEKYGGTGNNARQFRHTTRNLLRKRFEGLGGSVAGLPVIGGIVPLFHRWRVAMWSEQVSERAVAAATAAAVVAGAVTLGGIGLNPTPETKVDAGSGDVVSAFDSDGYGDTVVSTEFTEGDGADASTTTVTVADDGTVTLSTTTSSPSTTSAPLVEQHEIVLGPNPEQGLRITAAPSPQRQSEVRDNPVYVSLPGPDIDINGDGIVDPALEIGLDLEEKLGIDLPFVPTLDLDLAGARG